MKDNFVILYEIEYDSKNGYEIAINTPLGVFTGYTEPDPVDNLYPSRFHASEIALAKVTRKFAEAAVSHLKNEIKLIKNMIKQSVDSALDRADLDNTSFRILNGTLKQKQKELKLWESRVEALTKNIKDRVTARDKIVASYLKKDKTN